MSRELTACGLTAIPEVTMRWSCGQVLGSFMTGGLRKVDRALTPSTATKWMGPDNVTLSHALM